MRLSKKLERYATPYRVMNLSARVFLVRREKADPFAVENLDSNNVLEAEIQVVSVKAQSGDLASVMRKGALETKLLVTSDGSMTEKSG